VTYPAVHIFLAFVTWIVPAGNGVAARSLDAGFTSLFIMAMPVVAVVLAAYLRPPIPGARLVTIIALIEYALALFFGLITFLLGLSVVVGRVDSAADGADAFRHIVLGLADLGMIAVAAYVTFVAFTSLGGRSLGRA
jgi:hypothetical protein